MALTSVRTGTGFASSGTTTITASFTAGTATAGNLIVLAVAIDKASTGYAPTGSGWTNTVSISTTNTSLYVSWKTAAGGETGATATWSTGNTGGSSAWVNEFSESGSGAWTLFGSATSPASATSTTKTSGTTGTLTGSGTALAVYSLDSGSSGYGTPTYSNSYTLVFTPTGSGADSVLFVARKDVTSGTTTESTITRNGSPTADEMNGSVIVLGRLVGTTYTKTGGAAGIGAGSGPKTREFAGKAGSAASPGAGTGAKAVVHAKTGSGASTGAGSGAKVREFAGKTGAAAASGAGTGSKAVVHAKTGGGAGTGAGSGPKFVALGALTKTGGGAATGAGSGSRTLVYTKTGGGASAGAATGPGYAPVLPIAAYSFDESGSTVVDDSGNSKNWTLGGGLSRTGSGHTNGGITASGGAGGNITPAFGQTADRTVMVWVKDPPDVFDWIVQWNVISLDSGAWGLVILSTTITCQARNASGFVRANVARPTDGLWHHFAASYDSTNIRLYLDGALVDTQPITAPLRTDADEIKIMPNMSSPTVDDLRIFDKALKPNAIAYYQATPVTQAATTYTKSGGAASGGAASGSRSTNATKTGGGAAGGAAAGSKAVVHAKTGSGAGQGAGSGSKVRELAGKAGGGASPLAGSGSRSTNSSKSGGAAGAGAGSGSRSTNYTKTGAGATGAAASGAKTRELSGKSGGAVTAGAASGSKVVGAGQNYNESGGAAASGAASGSKSITGATTFTKTGGAVSSAAASGPKSISNDSTTYSKAGGAAAEGAGVGSKLFGVGTTYIKAGGGTATGAASGPKLIVTISASYTLPVTAGAPSRTQIVYAGQVVYYARAQSGLSQIRKVNGETPIFQPLAGGTPVDTSSP